MAIIVVVSETVMLFSMLFIVARLGHTSWDDFFSPLLRYFKKYV
jgi:hypothetical protein